LGGDANAQFILPSLPHRFDRDAKILKNFIEDFATLGLEIALAIR